MGQSRLSFRHRAVLFCYSVLALATTTVAPIRSAALSTIGQKLTVHPALHHSRPFLNAQLRASHSGYWHTDGSRILSDHHTPVRISGVNWSGLETVAAVPGGLDHQDYRTILRSVADAGYNTVRIPFSNQAIENPTIPSAIRFENESGPINASLDGLNSLQILDQVVYAAGELGLKVILDNHRSEAGSSAEGNGLWYTSQYPEEAWIADWITLAKRYKSNPTVVGFDLRNEPHNAATSGACWDCGGARDWHLAAQRAGDSILRVNSNLLIFVEGTDTVDGQSYWWGGNLAGVRRSPVHLSLPNRLVYSTHVYGPTEYPQSWFNAQTTPASLAAHFRSKWGYIAESGLAPVWVGEFGAPNDEVSLSSRAPGSEGQWFGALVSYLQQHPAIGWTYWGLNGEDRYALLNFNYSAPANPLKSQLLASIRQPSAASLSGSAYTLAEVPAPVTTAQVGPQTFAAEPAAAVPVAPPVVPAPDVTPYIPVVNYQPPAVSNTEVVRSRRSHGAAPLKPAATTDDAVAEEIRLATEQAMRNLPASK